MSAFDWPALMRIGLYNLRLTPQEFWMLTPLEFLIISGLYGRNSAIMGRADLTALCARFPDDKTE